jgi:conjugal transfer pilus assembly protein TrbC
MIRKNPLMIGGAIALLGAAAVLAQTVDGLDLGAVQKKGDAVSEDAAAFVNDIKRRSDALAQDAREAKTMNSGGWCGEPAALCRGARQG